MAINKKSNATDVSETFPTAGGSYIRNDDGSLTQVEGTDLRVQDASDKAQENPAAPASDLPLAP